MMNYFLVKDLGEIQSASNIKNQQDFLCLMYDKCIVFQEPFFSMTNFNDCYAFKNKKEKQSFFSQFAKKIEKLNSKYLDFYATNNDIVISCSKIYAEFWLLDKQTIVSGEVYNDICPHEDREYNLKNIFRILPLSQKDKAHINTLIRN